MKILGSAPTEERLLKLVTDFYCGSTIRFKGSQVFNAKGKIEGVRIVKKSNRFRFEMEGI